MTAGANDDKAPSKLNPAETLAIVAPYVFIAGLLLLLSALAQIMLKAVGGHGWLVVVLTYLAPLAVCTCSR